MFHVKHRKTFKDLFLPTVDRINNNRGYVPGNVATCCIRCNFIKRDLSLGELLCHLKKMIHGIAEYLGSQPQARKKSAGKKRSAKS